jgi:hypothetical protein
MCAEIALDWRNQIKDKSIDKTIRTTEPRTNKAVISVSRFSIEKREDSF